MTDRVPILPKLLSVSFRDVPTRALSPGALSLISPSVRKLNLDIDLDGWTQWDEKFRCIFTQSFNAAPEIEQLRLASHPSILGLPLLQTHCSRLYQLEVFPPLDLDSLRLLTELPALQHLSISLSREDFPGINPAIIFLSVTTLDVEGTWVNLGVMLETIRLPSIHTLFIRGWNYSERAAELAKAATQCFCTLAAKQPFLTRLSVCAIDGRVPPSHGCVVGCVEHVPDAFEATLLDIMNPLLALSTLRHLDLGFPSYFDIACTAADLRAVAEAFPVLETFDLGVWPYWAFEPQDAAAVAAERPRGGPLYALMYFARNCPRLRLLHLPAMGMAETKEAPADSADDSKCGRERELHGLQTLVIPKVLLPPGRADLAGKVEEVVRGIFPLVAAGFREERLVLDGDWAIADEALSCSECARRWGSTFL